MWPRRRQLNSLCLFTRRQRRVSNGCREAALTLRTLCAWRRITAATASKRNPRRPHLVHLRPHLRLHLRPQRRLSRRRCHHCYRRSCCRSQKSDKRSCRRGFGSRHHLACKGRSTERKGSESKRPAREQARRSASIGTPRSTAAARHSLGHTRSTRHPPAEGESERDKGGRKETRSERERESNLRPRRSSHRP